ncbi:MAG TPA: TIGR03089 family protein [Cellulomonas sp.]
MPTRAPSSVADVLSLLVTAPGRPRLTWYGADGERVELSGAVLDNWVSKTTNLLVEEYDAEPGSTVLIDLPPHWRAVLWALAVWRAGGTVLLPGAGGGGPVDLTVTDRPAAHGARPHAVVAVALPALARRFEGDLPTGAVDAAQAVMTYGDVIGWAPPTDPDRAALVGPAAGSTDLPVAHAGLVAAARASAATAAPGARTLLPVPGTRSGTGELLLRTLGVLAADGSVVLLADGADDPAARTSRTDRVVADERVTARLD